MDRFESSYVATEMSVADLSCRFGAEDLGAKALKAPRTVLWNSDCCSAVEHTPIQGTNPMVWLRTGRLQMRPKRVFGLCIFDFFNRFKSHLSQHPRQISTSNVEDGVYLDRVPAGTQLIVQTVNRQYLVETREGCEALVSGHPKYCPEPVGVTLYGSESRTATLLPGCIGPGLCLVLLHPSGRFIRTSRVREVRKPNSALLICSKSCTAEGKD